MNRFHINPKSGDAGRCKAENGNCPFGGESEHHPTAEAARAAYEREALSPEESGLVWPPVGLPKKLHKAANFADVARHYNDDYYDGGAGVCLGVSAFLSRKLVEAGIPHKLVRGEYTDTTGEAKAHWWIEANNWVIDASRGQFEEKTYRSGVLRSGHPSYRATEAFEPGHTSQELVVAELKRCFIEPAEAEAYHDVLLSLEEETDAF